MRLRLPQEGNCIFYAKFSMIDYDVDNIDVYESALADFKKEKSPPILKDQDLEIECLEIIILYLLRKFGVSISEFRNILKKILEGL